MTSQAGCLRVLHCIPGMGGGGAERQLAYLSRALADGGVEVHVALCEEGANMARLRASDAQVHMLRSRGHYDVSVFIQLVRLIRRVRPQIVQTWMYQMDVLGGMAALATGQRLVVSERTSAEGHGGNWKCRMRRWIAGRGGAVIANSEAGAVYWRNRRNVRTKVIGNIIAFDEINRADAGEVECPAFGGAKLIVAAGRLAEPKNSVRLVQAMAMAIGRDSRAAALVFGEGPLKEQLRQMCRSLNVAERVCFMGYTDQLYAWLKRADVFVSVSLWEGNPNTVREAAACRCPLAVSDIAAHREFLDESSAVFVRAESAESIADGIVRALSDGGARGRAERAFARVAGGRAEVAAEQYIAAYEEILEGRI